MQNIKIIFAYDGSKFNGSAKQLSKNTVHDKFEEALEVIGISSNLILSGRTDKNVHATGQVASLVIPSFWKDLTRLQITLLKHLPHSIRIKRIQKVPSDFHARFSAKTRVYRYIISTQELTAFNHNYLSYYNNINECKIRQALKDFIGIHDFEYFSKKGSDPKSTIREINDIKFYKYKDFYIFVFKGNSYLRSQIRMMISFILKISQEKLTLDDLQNQLNKKNIVSWTLASPNGLYLSKVIY
ncbi:tRNA pseudouridine synthase A [hydrothermal vent metagenome]|uniref:tRNA pseudouridine synthase A n=1 Tax=hydrothermal vent metagenome TaxID=652676 RepID=A0A3B1E9K1_9ZZZZ